MGMGTSVHITGSYFILLGLASSLIGRDIHGTKIDLDYIGWM